ncbi:MAG: hypothetical protein WAU53_06790, partial [Rhodoplanes sp.]
HHAIRRVAATSDRFEAMLHLLYQAPIGLFDNVPISRSAYGFCHGERGEIGRSRIPIARTRRVKTGP